MDLVGHWKLDELSGRTIKDSAGSNDGTWYGTQLVTDGAMTDTANWTDPGTWTVAGNIATRTASASNLTLTPAVALSLTRGKEYRIAFILTSTAGSISITSLDGTQTLATYVNGVDNNGTKYFTAVLTGDDLINFTADATFAGTIDSVSIRETVDSVLGPVSVKPVLLFDGVEDRIVVGDSASLDVTSITILAWVKLDSTFSSQGYIVGKMEDWAPGGQISYGFYVGGDRRPDFGVSDNGSTSDFEGGGTPLNLSQWHHVAGSYNENNDEYKIYIDGKSIPSSGGSESGPIHIGTGRLVIGAKYDSSESAYEALFNGKMGDIRIYDEALSPAQIHQLWSEGVRAGYRGRGRGRNR